MSFTFIKLIPKTSNRMVGFPQFVAQNYLMEIYSLALIKSGLKHN